MDSQRKLLQRALIGGGTAAIAMLWGGQIPTTANPQFISTAEARIGRPLTPVSVAGVARRTTRRAVAAGAVTGAAVATGTAAARAAAATRCVRVYGAYGRVATVCR